jgi:hypothetical protein
LFFRGVGGGGGWGGPRSNLAVHGLPYIMNSGSGGENVIVGLVPDDVIGVQLDERPAVMGENVFIADGGSTGRTLTLTTRFGQREIPLGAFDDGEKPPSPESG